MVQAARRRGEIAIGYRRNADAANAKANFGVLINPRKDTVLDVVAADQLVVIAADKF